MSYMWNEFNIKTFPAETIVWRDGVYNAELSTLKNAAIDKKLDRPVHIIYVGEIAGENNLNIDISASNQPVFLSVNIKNKKPAFLNIFIKNAGKNSEIRGHVMVENSSELNLNITGHHAGPDTGILINAKLLGNAGSKSVLSGTAMIDKNCNGCISDIGFSALLDKDASAKFTPAQRISSLPVSAGHSASIFTPTKMQIEYLRGGGLSGAEARAAITDAFKNDFPLF